MFDIEVLNKEGEDGGGGVVLNADGVYLTTYSTLLFNLKLVRCGYYHSEEKSLPITKVCYLFLPI